MLACFNYSYLQFILLVGESVNLNSLRSIYQYSNMVPRLTGQNCKFFVSFVSQFPKETACIQRNHH